MAVELQICQGAVLGMVRLWGPMTILGLFVLLVLLGLIFWGARAIMSAFQFPAPVVVLVTVLLVFIGVLLVFDAFGLSSSLPRLGVR